MPLVLGYSTLEAAVRYRQKWQSLAIGGMEVWERHSWALFEKGQIEFDSHPSRFVDLAWWYCLRYLHAETNRGGILSLLTSLE